MRSRADRERVERVLRAVALLTLVAWIANAVRPALRQRETVSEASLAHELPRLTQASRVDSVHVALDSAPDARRLAWLAALRRAGIGVTWSGAVPDVAVETFVAASPTGGHVLLASGAASGPRVVSDALGVLDTLSRNQSVMRFASAEGSVSLQLERQRAAARLAPVRPVRRVLVLGGAGWETKFIAASLEESGWQVDARMAIAPNRDVMQGQRAMLDTAHYAAVVLVDSTSAESARGLDAFARAGGGVVLAGDASSARSVAGLIAWRAGKREIASLGVPASDTSWRGQSRIPLEPIAARPGIAVESRGGRAMVMVRRHFAGRVIGVGYDQTWRWRMSGDEQLAAHREFWTRVVSSVAARPAAVLPDSVTTGSAPLAILTAALGASTSATFGAPPIPHTALANLLAALLFATLLAEWLLRRARGAR